MPTFEFICTSCGNLFDELTSPQQKTVTCPNCKETASRKNPVERISRPIVSYDGPMANMPTVSDKEMDRRVGFTSEKNWKTYEDQKTRIDNHREETGNPHVVLDGSGNPKTMSKEELEYRSGIQKIMNDGKIVDSYAETDEGEKIPLQKPNLVRAKKRDN